MKLQSISLTSLCLSLFLPACIIGGGDGSPGQAETSTTGAQSTGTQGSQGGDSTGTATTGTTGAETTGTTGAETTGTTGAGTTGTETTGTTGAGTTGTETTGTTGAETTGTTGAETTGTTGDASGNSSSSGDSSSSDSTGTEPSKVTCNPGKDDECNAGQKCTTYLSDLSKKQTDGTRCAPVTGTAKLGESCTRNRDAGTDDCGPMLFCDAGCSACDGPGVCIAYCDVENKDPAKDCADRGVEKAHCFGFNDGAIPICKKVCDPLAQDCEDAEQACHATLDNFLCTKFRPEPESDGTYGKPCDRVQSCAPGLTCRPAKEVEACKDQEDGKCCTTLCDTTKDKDECSQPLESCAPIFKEPVSGLEKVGVCVIPKSE